MSGHGLSVVLRSLNKESEWKGRYSCYTLKVTGGGPRGETVGVSGGQTVVNDTLPVV